MYFLISFKISTAKITRIGAERVIRTSVIRVSKSRNYLLTKRFRFVLSLCDSLSVLRPVWLGPNELLWINLIFILSMAARSIL